MEKSSRLEIKVGLFVFIGLTLLAVLIIQFSKGTSLFRGTYALKLHATNVGGLKERASVLLAGGDLSASDSATLVGTTGTDTVNVDLDAGTITGSWPRPRWFDLSMWGRPLDTCLMDVRFREKFQDALEMVHRRFGRAMKRLAE